jgi:threonine dehydratase
MSNSTKKTNPIADTLNARVYDVCHHTPLEKSETLSSRYGYDVLYKREDTQITRSYKARGAFNKIAKLTDHDRQKGVIAASAGNHAQGVALAARYFRIGCTIVMPQTTPQIKISAVQAYGADVVLHGDNYSDAAEYCHELCRSGTQTYIPPFDDIDVIRGQGTVGVEILMDRRDLTHIIVPVGGGGLLAGIAEYVKSVRPDVAVIGVESSDSASMTASLREGKPVCLDHIGIFADGVAVKQPGELTFSIAKQYVDEVICVNEDEICSAIKDIYLDTRSIVEPSGAMSVAALAKLQLTKSSVVACILSGANMNFERLQFIAERTMLGSGQETILSIQLPERPGALKKLLREVIRNHNITEFNYRMSNAEKAWIFVGLNIRNLNDQRHLYEQLDSHGYDFHDLTDSSIVKNHVRHMIGGRKPENVGEKIYEVVFPERPGALYEFVSALPKDVSITMFHYRGTGSDHSSVLIGLSTKKVINIPGYRLEPIENNGITELIG